MQNWVHEESILAHQGKGENIAFRGGGMEYGFWTNLHKPLRKKEEVLQ
jgi:hypothetical protein